ncbi:LacI family DNA-binding transcriptional regulator [Kineococcus terrestris]|uniref:LacI family DNA-binding transcriptional regulator n=1 Tax=Kineococcus terrestris TaxID=2044856 RepID=UPI0034DAD078
MPPAPRRTLQDVADAAGLSLAATSYALRGTRGAPATIERVRAVAAELGYRVDPIARALASGRTGTVGVAAALRDLWQQDLAVELNHALREHDLMAAIADSDADPAQERRVLEQFAAQRVDGVVAVPADPSADYWTLLDPGTALVTIGDALSARPDASAVLFDNRHGVSTSLRHLHGLGHRRVALLTPALPTTPGRPSQLLAQEVARELGLELTVAPSPASTAGAVAVARAALAAPERPTALFCLSDSLAYGAYRAARDAGLDVPGDVSVLGYDDQELAPLVAPPLTTTAWDEDAIVAAALEQLLRLLGAGERRPGPPGRVEFRPELVVRSSTGPAR